MKTLATDQYLITGTSSGLGLALVQELLQNPSARVIGLARRSGPAHPRYTHHTLDLSRPDDWPPGWEARLFPERPGARRLVLINNAGTLGGIAYAGQQRTADIVQAFQVNVVAMALLTNAFLARYAQHEAEQIIIHISSGAGKRPIDGWSLYCAAKAAADMHARTVAAEAAQQGRPLRVYALAPGIVDTSMQEQIRQAPAEQFSQRAQFRDYYAQGELAAPRAVASKIVRLMDNPALVSDVVVSVRDF